VEGLAMHQRQSACWLDLWISWDAVIRATSRGEQEGRTRGANKSKRKKMALAADSPAQLEERDPDDQAVSEQPGDEFHTTPFSPPHFSKQYCVYPTI
jgi:hypothetical protein